MEQATCVRSEAAEGDRPARSRPLLRRLAAHLPHLLGLILLAGAIYVVNREFRHIRLADIKAALAATPPRAIAASLGFTLLSYGILSFYDRLATIYAGHRISYRRTAFASFVAYVLSHNLGFSAVSGAAVRYRLYANWGLKPAEIARVVAFCSLTFMLGGTVLAGAVIVAAPDAIPFLGRRVPHGLLYLAGGLMWGAVLLYGTLSRRIGSIRIGGCELNLPGPLMACRQVLLATADVGATAAIAYALLPHAPGFGYMTFLAIYMASYTAGLLANLPGGLGVFDGAMMIGLQPYFPASQVVGMVLVFRLFYYVIPLFLAGAMFAAHETLLRGRGLAALVPRVLRPRPSAQAKLIRESEAEFAAAAAVGAVSLCGAMLLGLGLLDASSELGWPDLPAYQGASFLASFSGGYVPSLIGAALMVLAIGLSQRVTLAWGMTLVLLAAGAIYTALSGEPYAVPLVLLVAALLIAPFRRSYYRHARLLSEPLQPGTALPLLLLIGCVLALTHLAPRLAALEETSWWAVIVADSVPGGVRWAIALAVGVGLFAILRLILPGRVRWLEWRKGGRDRYCALAHAPEGPVDGVVFSETGRAAIAFRRYDSLLVGLGDPAGPEPDSVSAIWRLRDLAAQEGREPVVYKAGARLLGIYSDIGLSAWPLEPSPRPDDAQFLCCASEHGNALLQRLPEILGQRIPRPRFWQRRPLSRAAAKAAPH